MGLLSKRHPCQPVCWPARHPQLSFCNYPLQVNYTISLLITSTVRRVGAISFGVLAQFRSACWRDLHFQQRGYCPEAVALCAGIVAAARCKDNCIAPPSMNCRTGQRAAQASPRMPRRPQVSTFRQSSLLDSVEQMPRISHDANYSIITAVRSTAPASKTMKHDFAHMARFCYTTAMHEISDIPIRSAVDGPGT